MLNNIDYEVILLWGRVEGDRVVEWWSLLLVEEAYCSLWYGSVWGTCVMVWKLQSVSLVLF